jgi:hypothetical protein
MRKMSVQGFLDTMKFPSKEMMTINIALAAMIIPAGLLFRKLRSNKVTPGNTSKPSDTKPNDGPPKKDEYQTPTTPKSGSEANVLTVAASLKEIWKESTGRDGPTDTELLLVLSISWLETGLGAWWTDKTSEGKGDMRGSENLGAIQCRVKDMNPGPPPNTYRCVMWQDHHRDGTAYTTGFRYYQATNGKSAAQNAAADFLAQLSKPIRPRTSDVLANGGGPDEMAAAMRLERYFEAETEKYAAAIRSRAPSVAKLLGIKLPDAFKPKPKGVGAAEDNSPFRCRNIDPFANIRTVHHVQA